MAKNTKTHNIGDIEYKMTKELADAYIKQRKGEDKKKQHQEYLCEIVNTQFGIKGNCVKVLFF